MALLRRRQGDDSQGLLVISHDCKQSSATNRTTDVIRLTALGIGVQKYRRRRSDSFSGSLLALKSAKSLIVRLVSV